VKIREMEAPAKLTSIRLILIPLFMIFMVYDFGLDSGGKFAWPRIIAASFFLLAGVAYFIDKRLMRGRDISKGFWCFLDVVADKLLVFGALLAICFSEYILPYNFYRNLFFWSTAVIVLRELAIIGICLTESTINVNAFLENDKSRKLLNKATAALYFVCILVVVLEPILFSHKFFYDFRLLSLIVTVATVLVSVSSCLYSIMAYKNYICEQER